MKYIRWIVLSLLLAGIWCAMRSPDMGEAYARNVYPYISGALSCFSSLFSFSIGDCLIYGSMAGLLAYLVYAIVKKRSWRATAGRMIEYLLWIYVWFYLAWGLNYFRTFLHGRKSRMRLIQPTLFVRSYPLIQIR